MKVQHHRERPDRITGEEKLSLPPRDLMRTSSERGAMRVADLAALAFGASMLWILGSGISAFVNNDAGHQRKGYPSSIGSASDGF